MKIKPAIIRGLLAILNSRWLNHSPCKYAYVGNVERVGEIEIPPHPEWKVVDPPVFTVHREWLYAQIPTHERFQPPLSESQTPPTPVHDNQEEK